MLPARQEWTRNWPAPHSYRENPEAIVEWLESAPRGVQIEGPMREWGHSQDGVWTVDEYRSGQAPTKVGRFTSQELFDRWARYGLGWHVVRPQITTGELHRMVTGSSAKVIDQALDVLSGAETALWASFGLKPQPYNICDKRECRWRRLSDEFGWWDDDSEWQDALDEAGGDPAETDIMYSGEIYGTSVWKTDTHTACALNDGCGNRDVYIFRNKNEV
jgi:hypothetical protein